MAIVLRGKTICPLCGKTIQDGDNIAAFPAFVWNRSDPVFAFSDAGFHAECFSRHSLAVRVQSRYQEYSEHVGPGRRACYICGHQITDPKNHLLIGHLIDDPNHYLHQFNYAQYHRACFSKWSGRESLISKLREFEQSGAWGGNSLKTLIAELMTIT